MLARFGAVIEREETLVAEAYNVRNALIVPFRIELFRPVV